MQEFDYIIIGAGTAGGVLADKLTRSGQHRVLLLEAGGSHKNFMVDMPAGWGQLLYHKKMGWGYESEPNPAIDNRRLKLPRGKVLGGCSSTNGLLYVRGHKQDYADWEAAGATGWGWDALLPHFKATEDQHTINNPQLHAKGGALTANDLPFVHPSTKAMLQAAEQAGYRRTGDFNTGEPDGYGLWQVNIADGKRSSVARRAIEPAMARSNLTVQTGALVHRIVIDANQRATGVAYSVGSAAATQAVAKREVLLCAGAMNSPQILMLSGVGPAAHLQEKGITVKVDAPGVGQNLQDHVTTPMCWYFRDKNASMNATYSGLGALGAVFAYLFKKQGPMTFPATDFALYFKSDEGQRINDIQVFGLPVSGDAEATEGAGEGLKPDARPGMTMGPCQVRPYSRGHIALKTANPADAPAIHTNYLSDARDRKAFINAIRKIRHLTAQPALQALIAQEARPGVQQESDEAIWNWIKRYATSVHHAVGTVRMGAAEDALAPLTPDLKVKGVAGLRVVDASVMPNITSGNTNAPVAAIASRAADLILANAK